MRCFLNFLFQKVAGKCIFLYFCTRITINQQIYKTILWTQKKSWTI